MPLVRVLGNPAQKEPMWISIQMRSWPLVRLIQADVLTDTLSLRRTFCCLMCFHSRLLKSWAELWNDHSPLYTHSASAFSGYHACGCPAEHEAPCASRERLVGDNRSLAQIFWTTAQSACWCPQSMSSLRWMPMATSGRSHRRVYGYSGGYYSDRHMVWMKTKSKKCSKLPLMRKVMSKTTSIEASTEAEQVLYALQGALAADAALFNLKRSGRRLTVSGVGGTAMLNPDRQRIAQRHGDSMRSLHRSHSVD